MKIITRPNTAIKPHAAYYQDCQRNPETTAKGLSCNVRGYLEINFTKHLTIVNYIVNFAP